MCVCVCVCVCVSVCEQQDFISELISFFTANNLQHLISLLNPVYWTTATEVDGAVNGFTLTGGEFMREIQVEFATGQYSVI